MELPQIRLQSQIAKIQINRTNGQMSIKQPKAIQSIEQPKAQLQINTSPSKLNIDQSQAWADMDLKPISRRIEEAAQLGREALLEGITRRARQGNELMKIEHGGNPISRQAKENSEDSPKQFNIGWIPSAGSVKIDYEPAKVDITVIPRKPIIDIQPQKPLLNYQPGDIDVGMKQWNYLKIDFVNLFKNEA
ncbi:DUF6470 family protein [Radiobacillus kanasensis]|uniref:DUF6470 family protein n=1 Tax=Radiobacillus kanasensis TaxID=2844358 RepID=UPI001E5DE65A|nr:DUF6470 family protein [Radiobacillus kanasensis]UFT98547.1 DUF6470 family protein [Radiobacillus kanasensis]